jgi:hypothetical protein
MSYYKADHFTLIYDIGLQNVEWIKKLLDGISIEVTLSKIRLGDVSPVVFGEIESEPIQDLFHSIYNRVSENHNSKQVLVDQEFAGKKFKLENWKVIAPSSHF